MMQQTIKWSLRVFGAALGIAMLAGQVNQVNAANTTWPQFRGADSMGLGEETSTLPAAWSTSENVVWSADIPGRGWGSPIVWENKIFVTTAKSEKPVQVAKKGLYFGGKPESGEDTHSFKLLCIDFESGEVIWEAEPYKGPPGFTRHMKNSYASETPSTDGEMVYAYFGNLGIFAYDMDGEKVWERRFEPKETRYAWGTAASPIIHGDKLIIVNDNIEDSFIIALDKKTGEVIWKKGREEGSNWATPFIWENAQRTEIITAGTDKVRAYDLDGNQLWELTGMSSITIAVPFSSDGLLYISSGYVMDKLRPAYAIRPGASGDITLAEGETSNEFIAWSDSQAAPYNPTPILYKGIYYVLYDRGLFRAYDAKTGAPLYDRQRIDPAAAAFTSSPWAYNDQIFCLSEDGDTFVISAGADYEVVGKNSLDEMCMSTPAIAHGSLLLRTYGKLYRIETGAAGAGGE